MKVLRVVASLDPTTGGPPGSVVTSCVAATKFGVRETILSLSPKALCPLESEYAPLLTAGNVEHISIATSFGQIGQRYGAGTDLPEAIYRLAGTADILHCHGAWTASSLLSVIIGRNLRTPIIMTPHETLTEYDRRRGSSKLLSLAKQGLRHWYGKKVNTIIYSSELEQRDSHPGLACSSVVIPEALPVPTAIARTSDIDIGPRGLPIRLGFIGRLHRKKGLPICIDTLIHLPGAHLYIAGVGEEEPETRRRASTLGVADRVHFLGFVSGREKEHFLSSIHVLLMPSDYECFGRSAAEAMLRGLPVVVTNTTGVADVVRRGGGIVITHCVGPQLSVSVAAAVAELTRTPDAWAIASHMARSAAIGAFSPEAHGRHIVALYHQVAKSMVKL